MLYVVLIASTGAILLGIIAAKIFFGKFKRNDRLRPLPNGSQDDVRGVAELVWNRGARASVSSQNESISEDESLEIRDQIENASYGTISIAAQEEAQFEAKAEKKGHRKGEEQICAERKTKEQQAVAERKNSGAKRAATEKRQKVEEREPRKENESRKREHLKMKEEENRNWMQNIASYIKDHKIIAVEEVANRFGMKTSTVMNTIQELQKSDSLPGAMDSCGRFVYVSPENMSAVTNFIKQKGRVTIDDLAEVSTELINLSPVNKNR